jgi:uncharacterized protein YyaL (SSP411 family)
VIVSHGMIARMLLKLAGLAALAATLSTPPLFADESTSTTPTAVTSPFVGARLDERLGWQVLGAEAYERAQRENKPLLLLLGPGNAPECSAGLRALLGSSDLAEVLARAFVPVAADADERPEWRDLLDTAALVLARLESASADGDPGISALDDSGATVTWAALTPAGWPVAVGRFDATMRDGRAAERLARRLDALAARLTAAPAASSTQAGLALARLRAAQASEPIDGTLERALVQRALDGLRGVYDPSSGRFGASLHGPLRLLLAEAGAGQASARALLEPALDLLARQPLPVCRPALPELALRLRAHAGAFARFGRATDRAAAERAVQALLALRTASGAFALGSADERVLAGANGLAIGALALSSQALGRATDLAAAQAAATDVLARLGPAAELRRVARGNERGTPALLEDYAYLAEGLLELHDAAREGSGDAQHLRDALGLVAAAERRFADPAGGFFDTDRAHEPLPVRPRNAYDGATPNPNGVLASVLVRLATATGEARQREFARFTLMGFLSDLKTGPGGLATLAAAVGDVLGRSPSGPRAAAPEHGDAPKPSEAAHATRGPLAFALKLAPESARAGAACEARVDLRIAPGWSVNAHGTRVRGLFGLTVALLTDGLRAGAPRYPVPRELRRGLERDLMPAYVGDNAVVLPLALPAGVGPGPQVVRVRVAFQLCDAGACQAPDSVVLATPVQVLP